MAVPKHRKSKSKTRSRKSANEKRTMGQLSVCPQCSIGKLPHRVCPECGYYKDRVVKAPKTQNA